jgi:SAM-dependent methyltransferase
MSDDGIDWDQHARDARSFEGWPGLGDKEIFAKLPFSGKVLDMGSNICRWRNAFQWLSTLNGHKIEYYAYDGSPQVEEIVRQLYPEVPFTRGDIFEMGSKFEPEFFDVVYSSAFLQHFNNESKRRILGEVRKILKHGGFLIMAESFLPGGDVNETNDRVFTIGGWHKFMTENGLVPLAITMPYITYQYPSLNSL